MPSLPKIIVIFGPTASGKSELAVNLARKFNGEIISADSRQIYKGMDIGTAKVAHDQISNSTLPAGRQEFLISKQIPKSKIRISKQTYFYKGIEHHLIDIVPPNKTLTAAEYKEKALATAKEILKKGKIPIVCGGTGLYIRTIVDNLKIPEIPPNPKLRAKIEKEIDKKGLPSVYQKLLKLDPKAKEFIDPKNPRRIIRALEVCLLAKKPFSELRQKDEPLFEVLQVGINIPKEKLYKRINKRVDAQIKAGLLKEVRRLAKKYSWKLPSMSGLGYKEFKNYFVGKESLESAVETLKKNTRDYAKRQITWFKKDKRIQWIKNGKEAEKIVKNFLKKQLGG